MPPKNVCDTELWALAYKNVKARFKRWPSAYGGASIARRYVQLGGKYKTKRRRDGTGRWMREQWVQVAPYLRDHIIVPCGRGERGKSCRPLKRVSAQTPRTLGELVEQHGRARVLNLARVKASDMNARLSWSRMTASASKKQRKSNK
jgi:hypothetical protein